MTSLLPPGSRRAPAIAAIAAALFATGAAADPRSGSGPGEGGTNRLAGETSPYLLQHADNPVDWYPWGEEAFRRAREEDKPVFLSIGYSTCHWCHVMERESFSDAGVARLLNESFISVKVDREERPDVDAVYLAAGRLLDEEVGWPLNLVLTPDGRPFFAASYIPKDDRLGRRGMTTLLPQLAAAWAERRDSITMSADTVALGLRRDAAAGGTLDSDTLAAAYRDLEARFDEANGGFLPAPKFPSPDELRFLLRYWRRSGEAKALAMAEATLAAIRAGAIFDQIGHGVHRYATDAAWRVPHFEKMLYDQAMVSLAYVEAWQATGKGEHRAAAEEILGYVLRDLRAPGGAFFAAEDAESGGEEGAFYGWTAAEVRRVLGPEAPLAIEAFGIPAEGRGVPRRAKSAGAIAAERELTAAEVARRIERARKRLFDAREKRARPAADRKILADWNGLAIAALAAAGAAFDEPRYTDAARDAARFVLEHLRRDGALLHAWTAGSARIAGTLDDHAFLAWGMLNLYEASGEVRWLEAAIELEQQVATRFADPAGGYFMTADAEGLLPFRPKPLADREIPSGNSVQLLNLLRLGRMTGNQAYEEKADALIAAAAAAVERSPSRSSHLLSGLDFAAGPSFEIVLAGPQATPAARALRRPLFETFVPNKVVLFRPADDAPITRIAPFTELQRPLAGRPTAYVCVDFTCERPTTDPDAVVRTLLRRPADSP